LSEIRGSEGDDNVIGTEKADRIFAKAGDDFIDAGAGDDTIYDEAGDDVARGGEGDDTFFNTNGNDRLFGDAGDDTFFVSRAFSLAETIEISGAAGADVLVFSAGRAAFLEADLGPGEDRLVLKATPGQGAQIALGSGQDVIDLQTFSPAFITNPVRITDFATGDSGDAIDWDRFLGRELINWNDSENPFATGHLLLVQDGSSTLLQWDQNGGGDGSRNLLIFENTSAVTLTAFNFDGYAIFDIFGTQRDDVLIGSAGNDRFFALGGNDLVTGGAGGDVLDGGEGIDTLSYEGSSVAVFVRLQGYGSLANTQYAFGGDAQGDVLSGFENVIGSDKNDDIIGSTGANRIVGGKGADSIRAREGDDIVIGGIGGDNLDGGTGIDTLSYESSSAGVVVRLQGYGAAANTQYAFRGDAQGDILSGFENVIGSAHDDDIIGSDGVNDIQGGAGNDVIRGRAGGDNLNGGEGIDTLSYQGSSAGVTVRLQGFGDLANSQYAFRGDAQGDILSGFENVIGSSNGDDIIGSQGANDIRGGAGDDLIRGRAGADTLDGGEGLDTLSYEGSPASVSVRLQGYGHLAETQYAFGGDAQGDILSGFENVIGSPNADSIIGSETDNRLEGAGGNDVIRGRGGDDVFIFKGASTGSDVIEDFAAGEGSDDRIDLTRSVFADLADVLAHTNDSGSGDAVISKSGISITLLGVRKADLHADDFILPSPSAQAFERPFAGIASDGALALQFPAITEHSSRISSGPNALEIERGPSSHHHRPIPIHADGVIEGSTAAWFQAFDGGFGIV